jgi:hypothetical protein
MKVHHVITYHLGMKKTTSAVDQILV